MDFAEVEVEVERIMDDGVEGKVRRGGCKDGGRCDMRKEICKARGLREKEKVWEKR
jgi:hypothetical protein